MPDDLYFASSDDDCLAVGRGLIRTKTVRCESMRIWLAIAVQSSVEPNKQSYLRLLCCVPRKLSSYTAIAKPGLEVIGRHCLPTERVRCDTKRAKISERPGLRGL
jgi:hypothetical protein